MLDDFLSVHLPGASVLEGPTPSPKELQGSAAQCSCGEENCGAQWRTRHQMLAVGDEQGIL